MVEAMHHHISIVPRLAANAPKDRATGVARFVYRSIHGVVALVGNSLDVLLARLAPLLGDTGLARAETLSSVTVSLAFARGQVGHALDGTGFVVAEPLVLQIFANDIEREVNATNIVQAQGTGEIESF